MLFRRPRKRFVRQPENRTPEFSNSKQVQRSIERDLALTVRAHREQEENVAERGRIDNARGRFLLTRDRIVFGAKLAVTLISTGALVAATVAEMAPAAVVVSCGGAIGGIISLLLRPDSE